MAKDKKQEPLHPALADFLFYLQVERAASTNTISGYRSDLQMFLHFLAGRFASEPHQVDLSSVSRRDVRAFIAYLKNQRQNQARTINAKLSAIRSFYRFLVGSGEWSIQRNPVDGISSLREEKRLPEYLSLDEAEQLLESIQEHSDHPQRDYAIFMVLLQCGCRASELTGITIDSIDLKARTLRVYGKGSKERIVPLTWRTLRALEDYLAVRKPKVETDTLFLNDMGGPLTYEVLRRIFHDNVNRSPLKGRNLTPHKLRHTCLTLLMQAGVDIRTVQEIAGHSNIATTQIYTHVSIERAKAEMKKHPLG